MVGLEHYLTVAGAGDIKANVSNLDQKGMQMNELLKACCAEVSAFTSSGANLRPVVG